MKSRKFFSVITVMGNQCWSQAVLESGSVGGIVFYKHQL